MDKGIEELMKLLMELREFYDSMINPFIPVISSHIKGLESENKTNFKSHEEIPSRKEVERPLDLQENAPNFEHSKKNLIKDAEEVRVSSLLKSSNLIYAHPIYLYRCLSFLLGNGVREVLDALKESRVIENKIYKSLIGKLELMRNIKKPEPLGLVLSTYLLTQNFDERSMIIVYSLLSKRMQKVGFNNEQI